MVTTYTEVRHHDVFMVNRGFDEASDSIAVC